MENDDELTIKLEPNSGFMNMAPHHLTPIT